jgi:hypothetical protein
MRGPAFRAINPHLIAWGVGRGVREPRRLCLSACWLTSSTAGTRAQQHVNSAPARILLPKTAEFEMNNFVLNLPTFGFVVGTRAALGVGIGLLLSERLSSERRRALGLTLVGLGAATTIPAVMAVMRARSASREQDGFNDPMR